MTTAHVAAGIAIVALSLAAAAWGGFCWWQIRPSRAFWPLLRGAQAAVLVEVVLGGILLLQDRRPGDDLHYVYGLLPVLVSYLAEQLRIASAQMVLDARGIESAQAVGRLPEREQRSIVLAIVRREMGVMALAALAIAALAVRAATTA
jgi:hypothetical protein